MVRTLENGPFTEDSHGSDRDSPCAGPGEAVGW